MLYALFLSAQNSCDMFWCFYVVGIFGVFLPDFLFFDLQVAPLVQRVIIYPSITALVLLTFFNTNHIIIRANLLFNLVSFRFVTGIVVMVV